MGEPALPTRTDRDKALALSDEILERIRNDEMRPLMYVATSDLWLLSATLKFQVDVITAANELFEAVEAARNNDCVCAKCTRVNETLIAFAHARVVT